MTVSIQHDNNQWILSGESSPAVDGQWFEIDFWRRTDKVRGHSRGRNITWFVGEASEPMVLRHYYRGGLVGKLIKDGYLFTGLKNSRAYKEFALLQALEAMGLPACRGVAARVRRHGLIYRADLLMQQIDNAKDLTGWLQAGPLTDAQWRDIGKTLAQFHRQGVYHADLNAHNILLDDAGQVWLIDFDRGEIRTPESNWQGDNIARLQRSFEKELGRLSPFHYDSDAWETMHQAYRAAMDVG